MANRLTTEILINLAGNLTAKARQYGANMSEFARTNQRAMNVVKATSAAAGRAIDAVGNRYTGMIAGFASGAMLRNFADTDRRLTRLGISADKTKEQITSIYSDVQDVSIKTRIDDKELVGFLETVNAMTGDIEFGIKNLKSAALTIAGTGSSGESVGALFAQFQKYGINDDKNSTLAMDVLNRLGKEGAYELKDLAEKAGPSLSLYAAAGGRGVKGIKDVGVVMESAMDATGNRDTAATLVENFIREVQNPKIAAALEKKGVKIRDKNGKLKYSLPELLLMLSEGSARGGKKSGKGQLGELMDVGFTQTSLDLISGVSSQKGQENLRRYNAVVADGASIQKDATYAAQDFTSALQSLNTTWLKFANGNLAEPVQELADAINSVDQATVQNWLETGKNIAIAVGGVIAARKAFQVGKGAWDLFGGGKSKGIPKGVSDVFGSGVMPVYVVNMGAGGMGGAGNLPGGPGGTGDGAGAGAGRIAKFFRGVGKVAAPVVGAVALYDELETQYKLPGRIDDLTRQTAADSSASQDDRDFAAASQRNRQYMARKWDSLTNWFNSIGNDSQISDPRPWASMQPQNQPGYPFLPQQLQGNIEVVIKDDRVQVNRVKVNAPGVTMSAQSGVSNVEQD
ncbi:phage tail tape measure protein [Klebsiella pneumoniae]|uniref:phage tail tape measure protein n=1 Tax=Klebsiella pneumoniae complex TaxID=3390273 RepID=UPI000C7CB5E8|nr:MULTISPECIES: phage tail tape measure protein [Klebsiella]EKX2822516.1 phage tail tape measure protein [Klebsiella pneumoniae]ELC9131927.1 phage tail tape measure protein [Klebsiella pneumoniae]MDC7840688.1 phage tail tape measure protein [Klebsiella pneumoniae]MDQ5601474.1 phage tail tape measure protein [Klebsiella pneumoniae]MDU9213451.1 phage tail tape measure protein [Klebsiella pneumoniae]